MNSANAESRPTKDIFEASRVPKSMATGYRAMYAKGMHIRVHDAEDDKLTSDSGVAASVWRRQREPELGRTFLSGKWYVGWVEEIIELNYRSHCVAVLACSWIPADLERSNRKVMKDEYGFGMGNFQRRLPLGKESFAFPMQCKQVFYSDDHVWNNEKGGDWKVIMGTEVRGRRLAEDEDAPDIPLLHPGQDTDHNGLQGPYDDESARSEEESEEGPAAQDSESE